MDIWEFIAKDRFAMDAGCKLVSCENGEAVAEVEIDERHFNAGGMVQGGLIFTLADLAFAAAANSTGQRTVSLNATVNYIRTVRDGKLTARAVTISRTRSTCCVDVFVTDRLGNTVAKLQCTGYSKN